MSDFSNVHISWRFTFFHHFLWARNIFVSWASRYFQAFFVAGYFVASLNLDLSRGQILNDAKSIKNSKPALFWVSARANCGKKKFALLFSSVFDKGTTTHAKIGISILDYFSPPSIFWMGFYGIKLSGRSIVSNVSAVDRLIKSH